ncbi:ABC transporter ATP-binding protein [Azospirillum picis]|uniref:NitT/TauT family transport system ATP-binding protein n=1 Tax=Azospirillum picis TaxID=488438 RepID=A0ABU0MMV3_9PROT|nr:ABC transporter ATP-binding protein [Azospirillum picis]MBP2301234.1 NitT/TauT family transport system ATP-binding protein [Azospirillum picis]MDQ0534803.1 NitT/TauT family transport system ATP-binding protein [Azospirillum picis]
MAEPPDVLIRLDGVGKDYGGGVSALLPTSLAVGGGEFLVLLGPSGCGKTTLLRMIAGLLPPSSGGILISGEPLWSSGGRCRKALLCRLGLVLQDANLFPWLTAEENVLLPLELRGGSERGRRTARAQAMLALAGAGDLGSRLPHELSGGQRQRVAIARALSCDPDILLMDEPFAALDAISREALDLELQKLWLETGKTIILVTHSIAEAAFLADRVVLFAPRPGRIAELVELRFPRPREPELMFTPEFQQVVRHLHERMSALMGQA